MSPEKPTDEQAPEGADQQSEGSPIGQQAKPAAKDKPAAAKKPAAKKPAVKVDKQDEPVAAEAKSVAKKPVAKKPAEEKSPAEKTSTAEKSAEKKPVAKKADGAKTEKPATTKAEKSAAAKDDEPATIKAEKSAAAKDDEPATVTRREPKSAAATPRRKVVRAQARYVRTSARKARMVCGHLRGKSVGEARAILAFTPRDVARDWSKLLESAVANAENNHELIEDDLLVREAYADEGPTIKRFRPRAQGRATPIRKRTSHLTITLTPKP